MPDAIKSWSPGWSIFMGHYKVTFPYCTFLEQSHFTQPSLKGRVMPHLLKGKVTASIFGVNRWDSLFSPHLLIFYMAGHGGDELNWTELMPDLLMHQPMAIFAVLLFSFLIYTLKTLNFSLNTAFLASYKFLTSCISLSVCWKIFFEFMWVNCSIQVLFMSTV